MQKNLKRKLELSFLVLILFAAAFLGVNYYKSYSFKHNPLPRAYIERIENKERDILKHMRKNFGFVVKFPIVVTKKIPGRLYGLTAYQNGKITIYLNKKVMQESMDYMVKSVIPHEYAHALLFYLHKNTHEKQGHSKLWKETCVALGGKDCRQYVNQKEVILAKLPWIEK